MTSGQHFGFGSISLIKSAMSPTRLLMEPFKVVSSHSLGISAPVARLLTATRLKTDLRLVEEEAFRYRYLPTIDAGGGIEGTQ
jgi:hypothetical protein